MDKFSNSIIKKGFDSEPVYDKKYLKLEIKSYGGKISTTLHDNGLPNEGSHCIFLLVIWVDFVFKIGKYYYPQVLLEECKHIVKEKRISNYIGDELELSSDDSNKEAFDV